VLAQVFNFGVCRNVQITGLLQVVLSKTDKQIKEIREKLKWVAGFLCAEDDYSLFLVWLCSTSGLREVESSILVVLVM
jgi:hypothetical protein